MMSKEEYEEMFGMEACMDSVKFDIEKLGYNPIELLGVFTLRAKQDVMFNKTMIDALMLYIEQHNIKWDDKYYKFNK